MIFTFEILLLFSIGALPCTSSSVANSRNLEKIEVSEQRRYPNVSENAFNSSSFDRAENIQMTSDVSTSPLRPENIEKLTDKRSSDVFGVISQFDNILAIEKSRLLTPLPDDEYKFYSQRILNVTQRNARNCSDDISLVIAAARMQIKWALEMIDANGQPGYGSLRDRVHSIGNFDECMDVDTHLDFEGRYCTTNILISKIQQTKVTPPLQISLGLCFPSSCGSVDVEESIQNYLNSRGDIIAAATQTHCQERHLKLSRKPIIVIIICSIFIAIMAVATLYDAFYKKWWLEIQRNQYLNLESNGATSSSILKGHSESTPIRDSILPKSKLYSQDEAVNDKRSEIHIPKMLDQFLMSFSIYTNTPTLFSTHQPPGSISCIHGMKFLSLTWVILLHQIPYAQPTIGNMRDYVDYFYDNWTAMVLVTGDLAVDTFFAISGLLMTYLALKQLSNKGVTGQFFANFYIHRVWRLLPPCMLIMMTYVPLIKYIGKGPFWPQEGFEKDECKSTWWITMLYLNNFIKDHDRCMPWTWYLSCDMQFYVISPLIFLPLLYYGWKGFLSPLAFLLVSAITAGAITRDNHLVAKHGMDVMITGAVGHYETYYYIKPYTRIGSYVIGMITGYLLFKCEMKARLYKSVVILGWMASSATALAVTYGLYDHILPEDRSNVNVRALYNSLARIGWGMSVCWVVFACSNGYGGIVNTILSWKALIPLSRLTYCAYLTHEIVIQYFFYTRRSLYHLDNIRLTSSFLATLVVTYMISCVAYLAYEVPMTGLEKMIKSQAKKKG